MTNHLALLLDRAGLAEMSCIAGVGGGVLGLVNAARSGRPILALDGCVLACANACLNQAGVKPSTHVILNELGVKKRMHADFDRDQAREIYTERIIPAAQALNERSALHALVPAARRATDSPPADGGPPATPRHESERQNAPTRRNDVDLECSSAPR